MAEKTDSDSITLTPIGCIKNDNEKPSSSSDGNIDIEERRRQVRERYNKVKQSVSELEIDPTYDDLLDGIEAFSHIMVIYWPHLLSETDREIRKVRPMRRKDLPEQGVFATRSPTRPNPILISVVKLLERKKNVLFVQGLDALNASPILDIKPIVGEHEGIENPKFPDWVKEIHKDLE